MILTLPHLYLSLRWVTPAVAIIGVSPIYLTKWVAIKILTLPLPGRFFRRLEERLYSSYQAMIGFYYETWSGVEFCFYGDKIPDKPENVLYLSNHQCSVDWVIPEVLCVKQGGYGGRARYILKNTLKYIPLYGWFLGHRGGIFVRRGKNKQQDTLIKGLRHFVESDMSVWLVIFPEGTRYNPDTLQRSKEYARNLGLPELNQVLTPRTTGFELALEHMRDHFDAVYDVTIFYEGGMGKGGRATPHLFSFFCGSVRKVHIHIKRILLKDIPRDVNEQKTWLYRAYQEKDLMLEEFLHGRCSATPFPFPLHLSQSFLPTVVFGSLMAVSILTRAGRITWLSSFLFFTAVTFISAITSK